MVEHQNSTPTPPEPDPATPAPREPHGDPLRGPQREPWHDPGPPTRKVNLPPDSPSPGVPVPKPENPMIS